MSRHYELPTYLCLIILLALSPRILVFKYISCDAACNPTRAVVGLFYDGDDARNEV